MTKITLTDLANLENENTAVAAINANNAVIETAFDNTLSRDGTSPNTMGSNFDMNSHRIVNLPAPISLQEPLRLVDANTLNGGGTISALPAGGTTNQTIKKNSNADYDVSWGNGTGVTSVALSLPADFTVTGSPITASGTLGATYASGTPTGTGAFVRATSPALTTPALGTPSAAVLTNATGLPLSGLNTQAAYTLVGNNTGSSAVPTAVDIAGLTIKASPASSDYILVSDQAASGAWKKATVSSVGSSAGVASIAGNTGAFTLGAGLTNSTNDLRASLTNYTAILGADVTSTTTAYTDVVNVAQGTTGTFFATCSFIILATAGISIPFWKLWDGTNLIASGGVNIASLNTRNHICISGIISSPVGNIRLSVSEANAGTNVVKANSTGLAKDTVLSVIRIA